MEFERIDSWSTGQLDLYSQISICHQNSPRKHKRVGGSEEVPGLRELEVLRELPLEHAPDRAAPDKLDAGRWGAILYFISHKNTFCTNFKTYI